MNHVCLGFLKRSERSVTYEEFTDWYCRGAHIRLVKWTKSLFHVYYNYIKSQGPFQNVYLCENVPDLSFYVSILFFKFHSTLVWSILYSVQVFSRQYSIEQYLFLRE